MSKTSEQHPELERSETVEQIAKTVRSMYCEWGTIRGTLDQITVSPNAHKFRLKHQLTGAEVSCTFPVELLKELKDALPHRIEVYGRVKYNRTNQPKSVEAETIRLLPDSFVPFNQVRAVNITGDVESEDYVEGLRSGG